MRKYGSRELSGLEYRQIIDYVEQLEAEVERLRSADYWCNWVYPEGATPEDIQNELADFKDIMGRFSRVLDYATGGRMSKPTYTVEAMCSVIDEYYADALQESE